MNEILNAIKTTIERYLLVSHPLTESASIGDCAVYISDTSRFSSGEIIIVGNEISTIQSICDSQTLILANPLTANHAITDDVRKIHAENTVPVFVGSAGVVPGTAWIELHPVGQTTERTTLRGMTKAYEIAVLVATEANCSQEAYQSLLALTKSLETSLMRSYRPVIAPYWQTTLANGTSADDATIQLTDDILYPNQDFAIESQEYPVLRWLRCSSYEGSNVYSLAGAVGFSFGAGDKVIIPRRWIYDSEQYETSYPTAERIMGDTEITLKTSIIRYRLKEYQVAIPSNDLITR